MKIKLRKAEKKCQCPDFEIRESNKKHNSKVDEQLNNGLHEIMKECSSEVK